MEQFVDAKSFWQSPEQVEAFAARPPDKRLTELLESFKAPSQTRVLDLGCAGGRNTVMLAERGFDVYAVDNSPAMIEKTRERVSLVWGDEEATQRVWFAQMDNLQEFDSASFHLVVALGIYQNADSQQQWEAALRETVRVLAREGQVLLSSFSPKSNPTGSGLKRVTGEQHIYEGFYSSKLYLLEPEYLDAEMARHGLTPVVPTATVKVAMDAGFRVTINAHYRKQ